MAKKDGGGKKKKDAEVAEPVNAPEVEADLAAPTAVNGHALEERLASSSPAGPPEPPPLPPVGVEPQALPPVTVEPVEPIEPPLAEVTPPPISRPTPTPTPTQAAPRPVPAPVPTASGSSGWSGSDLADVAVVPLQVVRSVLPTSRTSVVLGVVALGLVGVLDWPAALGVGLGWEALRRWGPETPRR